MGKFIQGAAFYLFSYFILGLVNTGIMYFMTRILHFMPAITVTLLMFLTVFVLFFAFKKSLELFVFGGSAPDLPTWKVVLAWIVHFVTFVALGTLVELSLFSLLKNPKLVKVLTVFFNFVIFFLLYFLVVKVIVGVKDET